ncbi:deoxyribodipyrimidine photo-lyase [Desulfatitalea alkaliphila]|uniref:Deoxyribodipyrimidine photo-lyase n=1 Tax=Desulfatitalea alkaliphila TaxID=2929485 RepID=A0AA41R1Y3_9BACT|nr:deoxyribodipyrimidine photo-lyase [Desulfatitalea alkaliphila]MCJ8501094.1 deoxyribodipyrimidine photo-lyase [Desulfatitalea alkaliphila]
MFESALAFPHPIAPARIQVLNDQPLRGGDFILYWMQQSQRAQDNHALTCAVAMANHCALPLLVVFGLTPDYPEANQRHYRFMLEGLREVRDDLAKSGVRLAVVIGHPPEVALNAAHKAAAVVCDRGYLRHQKQWRREVADQARCAVVQVESDVVVPVDLVSDKAEYAARTIRPKIRRHLAGFLKPVPTVALRRTGGVPRMSKALAPVSLDDLSPVPGVDERVVPADRFFVGGAREAEKRLQHFIRNGLAQYTAHGNQPQTDDVSHLSPYLHFGQISPLRVAMALTRRRASVALDGQIDAFLEQLVVRRELACNFVHHTPDYDAYTCIPEWARRTLAAHRDDPRPYLYTPAQLENARTHDRYWNAAMQEMRGTGFMHNYMRMYWGKKILEWCPDPASAFATALMLNNRYFIDGRDPNSYAGVAWVFGVHDRAWAERPVFGKLRYMAAAGLERKCDIEGYVRKVESRMA